jgi:ornithine lipid ester-linked acyl 2-hydroxylase
MWSTPTASVVSMTYIERRRGIVIKMFFDTNTFSFVIILEANWTIIQREHQQLSEENFMAWPERHLYKEGWHIFALYAYGRKIERNCRLCPETARLVEKVPGMTTAGFSRLAPGAHIQPHTGFTNALLRCHLGVDVHEGCLLRVGRETKPWLQGKCLIFDDTIEHEAWNQSGSYRTVLLIDFKRPEEMLNKANP